MKNAFNRMRTWILVPTKIARTRTHTQLCRLLSDLETLEKLRSLGVKLTPHTGLKQVCPSSVCLVFLFLNINCCKLICHLFLNQGYFCVLVELWPLYSLISLFKLKLQMSFMFHTSLKGLRWVYFTVSGDAVILFFSRHQLQCLAMCLE